MRIGSYQLENNLILAPMAGISGRPFQELCKQFGAGSALLRDETLVKKILEYVLDTTGADTIMIGRAAQGNPWLFNQIHHFLDRGKHVEKPTVPAIRSTIMSHLEQLYCFYGNVSGVRIARKHIGWYFKYFGSISQHTKNNINQTSAPSQQIMLVRAALDILIRECGKNNGNI